MRWISIQDKLSTVHQEGHDVWSNDGMFNVIKGHLVVFHLLEWFVLLGQSNQWWSSFAKGFEESVVVIIYYKYTMHITNFLEMGQQTIFT